MFILVALGMVKVLVLSRMSTLVTEWPSGTWDPLTVSAVIPKQFVFNGLHQYRTHFLGKFFPTSFIIASPPVLCPYAFFIESKVCDVWLVGRSCHLVAPHYHWLARITN